MVIICSIRLFFSRIDNEEWIKSYTWNYHIIGLGNIKENIRTSIEEIRWTINIKGWAFWIRMHIFNWLKMNKSKLYKKINKLPSFVLSTLILIIVFSSSIPLGLVFIYIKVFWLNYTFHIFSFWANSPKLR